MPQRRVLVEWRGHERPALVWSLPAGTNRDEALTMIRALVDPATPETCEAA